MQVHLENFVMVKGVIRRECFFVGNMTEDEVAKLPGAITWEKKEIGGDSAIKTWYIVSLEDHEREEIQKRKNRPTLTL